MSDAATGPLEGLINRIQTLRSRWGWVVGFGVVLTLCGLWALNSVVAATVASVWMVGIMMMAGGVAEIAHGITMKGWGRTLLWVLLGVLYLLAGMFTMLNPLLASVPLTLLLAAGLIASGVMRILLALQLRKDDGKPWVWAALSGLVTVVLGGIILAKWPTSSLIFLGVFLAVDLLMAGLSWITVGLALRPRKTASA